MKQHLTDEQGVLKMVPELNHQGDSPPLEGKTCESLAKHPNPDQHR
jgi:hypothetical protein